MDKRGLLSRSQAAAALGVTPKTLYTWERAGKIKGPERDWRGWRWYAPADIAAIRNELLGAPEPEGPTLPLGLDISAQNRFEGTIRQISGDSVLCEVVMDLESGQQSVTAIVTREAVRRLGLKVGGKAIAFVNASDVMLGQ